MSNSDYKFSPGGRRADQHVKEQVANIVLFDVSDPMLSNVTITGCDVSPDKRNAKIYFTCAKSDYDQVESAFKSANGYIRKLLGDRLTWRVVPALNFYLDPSVDMGESIAKALAQEE